MRMALFSGIAPALRGGAMAKQGLAAVAAAGTVWLSGCGTDLGECDMAALGGSSDVSAPAPHAAQIIVSSRCATCHSATTSGEARFGAPAELDFDVVPANKSVEEIGKVQDGAAVVQDEREDMWALIEDGEMPPKPPAGSGELSEQDKETVRNWLACGAPVIATPVAVDPNADAWTGIYTMLSSMTCQGCHGPASPMGAFLPASGGTACDAHHGVVGVAASGPECGGSGAVLVQAGNPGGSLLLQKLKGTQTCGAAMPFGLPDPLAVTNPMLVDMIEQWIMAGAPAPEGCP